MSSRRVVHAGVLEVASFLENQDPFELFHGGVEASFGLGTGRKREEGERWQEGKEEEGRKRSVESGGRET